MGASPLGTNLKLTHTITTAYNQTGPLTPRDTLVVQDYVRVNPVSQLLSGNARRKPRLKVASSDPTRGGSWFFMYNHDIKHVSFGLLPLEARVSSPK